MSDIVSVGHGYVNESDGSCTTDLLIARIAREAYARGYRRGKQAADAGFISGLIWASVVWVIAILFARAL